MRLTWETDKGIKKQRFSLIGSVSFSPTHALCPSSLQANSLPFSHSSRLSTCSITYSSGTWEGRNVNNIFLAMLPLFFQMESTESTKLLLPLCTLFLTGDFAVDRQGGGELLQTHEEKQRRGRKKGATRWIMSVLPCPPNIYCYRLEKKECGNEDNELKKKHGEASRCLSCPTAHWSTQDYGLHCTAFSSQRVVAWATLFSKSARNKPVHILLWENKVSAAMWKGLIGSFEVTLVTKLINNLMPIIHFNHGRWHLLPELRSTFTTAVLLKGHNQLKACFVFLQPAQFQIQNVGSMLDFNYLKKK